MSNVTSLTERLDDWRIIKEIELESGDLLIVRGNYRKNAHEIEFSSALHKTRIGLMEIAQLQDAIKEYEERDESTNVS